MDRTVTADAGSSARRDSVDALLTRAAARSPDRVALRFGERDLTYGRLDAAITAAARRLLELGLSPGDRVAAYGANSDAYVVAFLAASRAGLVHVPVNYALKHEELSFILSDSGARVVLTDPQLRDDVLTELSATRVETVLTLHGEPESLLDAALAATDAQPAVPDQTGSTGGGRHAAAQPPPEPDENALVQLLYTSGTTARPKGAMMTHRALIHEYVSCVVALDLAAEDRPLVCMPLYHSAAMHVFTLPYLSIGATIRILANPDVPRVLATIEEEQIGSLFLAPTVWVPLSQHPDLQTRDLSSLRKAQYGASIMPVTVLERLRARYPDVAFYNAFGQSEIAPLACVLRPEEHEQRPASAGRPVLFVQVRVVDALGNDVPDDEPGEILYRSPQLCSGYWGNPEATEEAFQGGWFHSGDLVRRDSEGYITVVDRIKDAINTGGVMVASREVEDAIYIHDAVAEVAVVGLPDERWIEAITAFIVVKPGHTLAADEVIAHVRERLAPFKVPKAVHFLAELPKNQSGKLLKRELRDRAS